jgi:phosphoribosyl 1,2-cyclic phosphodiesterase
MFGFLPFASGSKGNCLFVGGKKTRILIDAGLSFSLTMERLQEALIDPKTIQAILVTHEHSDHISGLANLAYKLSIPVLANAETAKGICAALRERPKFKIFTTGESFQFGDLHVQPFSIPHDTFDPVAFTIQTDGIKLGICADLGHVTSLIKKQMEKCDFLYLEANHEPSMVHASNRPQMLKTRILGKQGHLSNQQCAELLISVFHSKLKHVHLAHLSGECNTKEKALEVIGEALKAHKHSVELSIAHQEKASKPIFFENL